MIRNKANNNNSNNNNVNKVINLPDWIFDVDSDDEYDNDTSILQELDIDLNQIYKSTLWMYFGPLYKLCGKVYERNPLYISNTNSNISNNNIDFWGPCSVISLYGLILWLGRVKDVPWIYVIWSLAAVFNHLVNRVWFNSTLMIHFSLLGYSVAPLIPFAAIILLICPPIWFSTILEIVSIIWSSSSAILSYFTIINLTEENKSKLKLLFPIVVLMEMYLISLIPIRHK